MPLASLGTRIALLGALAATAPTQDEERLRARDVTWQELGGRSADGRTLTLIARGWFSLPGLGGPRSAAVRDGRTRFLTGWLDAHPDAHVIVVQRLPDWELTWVRVVDGEHDLAVDLVRAGWVRATTLDPIVNTGEFAVDADALAAFAARVAAAERDALATQAGLWSDPHFVHEFDRRRADLAFDDGRFADAVALYRKLQKVGDPTGTTALRISQCLVALGEDAMVERDRALADSHGGNLWYLHCYEIAEEITRSDGLDAAVAWLRGLADWYPQEPETVRVLAQWLLEADRHDACVELLAQRLPAAKRAANVSFDDDGRLRWSDASFLPAARGASPVDVMLWLSLAARAESARGNDATAERLTRQHDALAAVLQRLDRSGVAPTRLDASTLASTPIEELVAALQEPHPEDVHLACVEAARRARADALTPRELHTLANAALVLHSRSQPARWLPEAGQVVDAAWAAGQLTTAQQTDYLRRAVDDLAVVVFEEPVYEIDADGAPVASSTELLVVVDARWRATPPPARNATPGPVTYTVTLTDLVVRVNGVRAEPRSRRGEPAPERIELLPFGGSFQLPWAASPSSRHHLDLTGTVVVRAATADREPVEVRAEVACRVPFFAFGAPR